MSGASIQPNDWLHPGWILKHIESHLSLVQPRGSFKQRNCPWTCWIFDVWGVSLSFQPHPPTRMQAIPTGSIENGPLERLKVTSGLISLQYGISTTQTNTASVLRLNLDLWLIPTLWIYCAALVADPQRYFPSWGSSQICLKTRHIFSMNVLSTWRFLSFWETSPNSSPII